MFMKENPDRKKIMNRSFRDHFMLFYPPELLSYVIQLQAEQYDTANTK